MAETNIIPPYEAWFARQHPPASLQATWSPCKEWQRHMVMVPGTDGTALFMIQDSRCPEAGPTSTIEVVGWLYIHHERMTIHMVQCRMVYAFTAAPDAKQGGSFLAEDLCFVNGGLRAFRRPRPNFSPAEMLSVFTREVFGPGWRFSIGMNERKIKSLHKTLRRHCSGLCVLAPSVFQHVARRTLPRWAQFWQVAKDLPCGADEVAFLERCLKEGEGAAAMQRGVVPL